MIDWSKVTELRQEIGGEDFAEVVDLFLEEVDEAMQRLRDGCPGDRLECCLHFLKGSALNLGFDAFSTLCAAGEASAALGNTDQVDVAEICHVFDESKALFLDELPARLAA
ncbi:Hpt domain-containing protein [Alisedimentitalea sp. MJ-SS2]|uniref:Hpt domain-containing protein n=1 Tax=Aliisedimentitalea sp. MJ-SS2 TaxID=3049795 RepID=UPI00290D0AED|nr:Hpt domain-containing protein [Alisedimentitalea sp. MJ-SS2]MDU8927899.1 Hpt domain-containing protein [Alisedimentitalea sp. MJ-SS2]